MSVIKNIFKGSLVVFFAGGGFVYGQDLGQAVQMLDKGQISQAKQALQAILKQQPDQGEAYYYLGNVYLQQGIVDSAKAQFDQGVALKNNGFLNYIGLGQLDLLQGNTSGATLNFAKAQSKIKRRDYDQKLLIAKAYLQGDSPDFVMARTIAQEVLQEDMQNVNAYMVLGQADLMQGKGQEAYDNYRQATLLQGDNQVAKLALALILQKSGGFAPGVQQIQEIIAADPNFGQAYKALGDTYYSWSLKDKANSKTLQDKANTAYLQYLNLVGDNPQGELDYVKFLLEVNKASEAVGFITTLKSKYPKDSSLNSLLARAYFLDQQYQEASVALEKVVSQDPNSSGQIYFDLASAYLLKPNASESDYKSALANFKIAVQKQASLSNSFNTLGVSLLREKKYALAIEVFKIATDNPQSDNYSADLYYVGYCSYLLAEESSDSTQESLVDQSNLYFDKCLASGKYMVEANFYKARVNRLLSTQEKYYQEVYQGYNGFVQQMKKSTQELGKQDTQHLVEAYNWLGSYYANQEEYFKAKECFNITLSLDPNNSYALSTLKALEGN